MKKSLFLVLFIISGSLLAAGSTLPAASQNKQINALEKRLTQLEQRISIIERDQFHNKPYALLDRYALNFNPEKCDTNIFDYVLSQEEMREAEGQLVVQIVSDLKTCERFGKKNFYAIYIPELKKTFIVEDKEVIKLND